MLTFLGTFGLFFTLFLLFLRWLPMIAIAEVKMVIPEADPHHAGGHALSAGGSRGESEPHVAEPGLLTGED